VLEGELEATTSSFSTEQPRKKREKKFFFFFYVCEPLTLHSSAPPLSNYTPTPWAAALSGGGKYIREKNSIIIKKGVSLSCFYEWSSCGREKGRKKKKGAPEEEVVWGLVHSFLLPSIRLASSSG
jgi:hypothetical protein